MYGYGYLNGYFYPETYCDYNGIPLTVCLSP